MEFLFPYVPPEVFTMEPQTSDVFITLSGKTQRVIFSNVPLTPEEEKHMTEFRKYLADNKKTFPAWVDDKDRHVLRFLQGNGWDYAKTAKSLDEHLEWRIQNLPMESEDIEELAKKGLIYWFGRDKRYRPVLHLNVKKISESGLPNETLSNLAIFMLEFALKSLMVPGKVESMIVVVNMTGVSTISIPVTALKTIGQMLQNNYRARLYQQFVLNTPFIVKGIWAIAKGFLEEFTVAKFHILGGDFTELYAQVDKSQLEKKLGGECEDIEDDFFPPQSPSS